MKYDKYERTVHNVSFKFLFVHVTKQVKLNFNLQQTMKAQRGKRSITLLFL